jgi:hypothetical protein
MIFIFGFGIIQLKNCKIQLKEGAMWKRSNNLKSIFFSLFAFHAMATFSHGEIISSGILVENIAAEITNDMGELINKLETSGTITSFNIRSDLMIVLENIKILGEELTGTTFGELSDAQKQFFERSTTLINESLSGINVTTQKVNGIVSSMSEALSRVPGMDGRPFVTNYFPSYVLKGEGNYPISIQGSLIGNGEPSLRFGNEICEIRTKTERLVEFNCSEDIFNSSANWVSGMLTVTSKKAWHDFMSNQNRYEYNLSLRSIDRKIGQYSLDVFVKKVVEIRRNRNQPNSYRNGHCQGDREMVWTYNPASGCKIDVQSVKVDHSKSSQSTYNGVQNLSRNGFQVTGIVRNNGPCAPRVFGVRAYVDGRGALNVNAKWVDICLEEKEVKLETQTGELTWKKQKSFQMPVNTTRFILTIRQINGEEIVVNGNSSHRWFNVDYDPKGKLAIFRPKALNAAFK